MNRARRAVRPRAGPAGAGSAPAVGLDLVDVARFRAVLDAWGARFTGRVFLESERRYCEARAHPWLHYAARFAVKEAVAKALGTGIGAALGWRDIEVIVRPGGEPSVALSAKGRALAARRGLRRIVASLSHTPSAAAAVVLLTD